MCFKHSNGDRERKEYLDMAIYIYIYIYPLNKVESVMSQYTSQLLAEKRQYFHPTGLLMCSCFGLQALQLRSAGVDLTPLWFEPGSSRSTYAEHNLTWIFATLSLYDKSVLFKDDLLEILPGAAR